MRGENGFEIEFGGFPEAGALKVLADYLRRNV